MGLTNPEKTKQLIKDLSARAGFLYCGFSRAQKLEQEARRLEDWLRRGLHGEMKWMENHFEKRVDPTLLVPGAKTVITFVHNYFPAAVQEKHLPQIAKYAYGPDYHVVLKNRLRALIEEVQETTGPVGGRVFTDSAPVLEKAWALRSGAGWIGKNTNLIMPRAGSFFFLAEWICEWELPEDAPIKDHCGTCTRCIDACPTGALNEPYVLDASKCISYLTIELRASIPQQFSGMMEGWAFGCDICQDVCPWNRFSTPESGAAFSPLEGVLSLTTKDWEEMTKETFSRRFGTSALSRTGLNGMQRNVAFIKKDQDNSLQA